MRVDEGTDFAITSVFMWKSALAFILVAALARPGLAETLVVASGRFHLTWEEQDVPAKAAMIKDKIVYAAREQGWDVQETETTCLEPACLDRLLTEKHADEAVYVMAEENVGEYAMDVHFARRESFSVEFTGAFPQALLALRDKVKEALAPQSGEASTPAGESLETAAPPSSGPAEYPAQSGRIDREHPLGQAPFWVSLGVTGAALIAYVATGIAGDARWDEVASEPPGMRTRSDQDFLSGIQTANRALLGVTLAGAATTGVLFLFTDFKREREKPRGEEDKVGAALRPVLSADGGGLCLEGTF